MCIRDSHKLVKTARTTPETLKDITYLEQINEELTNKNSYLVVRRDDKVVYIGAVSYTHLSIFNFFIIVGKDSL